MELARLHLTKRELYDLLEIVRGCLTVRTDGDLKSLLSRVRRLVPSANVVAGLGRTDRAGRFQDIAKIVNVSYPDDWMSLYVERGFAAVDPVLRSHFGRFQPQVWSQTYRRAGSKGEKAFIAQAKEFDLSEGITVGAASERRAVGSLFSFAGRAIGEHVRHAAVLDYLAPHLHLALMRTTFSPSRAIPQLSVREREVLNWIKEGKTNWEIAQILGVSEATVKFHVRNVLSKFEASTRGHAVALAMEHGMIGL